MEELDRKSLQILSSLDFDARISLTELAKLTRLSKQAVAHRITQLEKRGIISGYYAVVDIAKLGYTIYRIGLKFDAYDPDNEKAMHKFCSSMSDVGWLFHVQGKWDAVISMYAKDIHQFYKFFQKIITQYGNKISEYSISVVVELHNYPQRFIYEDKRQTKQIVTGNIVKNIKLDEIDCELLRILSNNARAPITEIAEKMGENPRTLLNRMKKMKKQDIIQQFRAKINTSLLGYEHTKVFLYLRVLDKNLINAIMEYFKLEPNVIYCTLAVGLADLEFETKTRNSEEFYQLILRLRNQFKDKIKSIDSVIIRKEQMINYYPF